MIHAGELRMAHPGADDAHVVREAGDGALIVAMHGAQLVLWRTMEGGWIAKRVAEYPVEVAHARPLADAVTLRADVWIEGERAVMASAWGALNEGSFRLTYRPARGPRAAYWFGAHLTHDGRVRLTCAPRASAADALASLEATADILEISDDRAAGRGDFQK